MNDISLSVDLFTDWKSGCFIVSLELVTRCIQLEGNIKTRKDVTVLDVQVFIVSQHASFN